MHACMTMRVYVPMFKTGKGGTGSVRITVLTEVNARTSMWCPRIFSGWAGVRCGFAALDTLVDAANDLHKAIASAGLTAAATRLCADRQCADVCVLRMHTGGIAAVCSDGPQSLGPGQGVVFRTYKLKQEHANWDRHVQRLQVRMPLTAGGEECCVSVGS